MSKVCGWFVLFWYFIVRLSALVLRPTSHLHSAHTHRLCTDLLKDGKQLTTWGLWMHTGTDHRHLRNPLFPLPALSWGATTTAPPVTPCSATRPRPEGKAPSPRQARGCGAAQRGLPELARPGLACSRPPCVTLGDLLVNDPRHRG